MENTVISLHRTLLTKVRYIFLREKSAQSLTVIKRQNTGIKIPCFIQFHSIPLRASLKHEIELPWTTLNNSGLNASFPRNYLLFVRELKSTVKNEITKWQAVSQKENFKRTAHGLHRCLTL
jgi:hypothetical protein